MHVRWVRAYQFFLFRQFSCTVLHVCFSYKIGGNDGGQMRLKISRNALLSCHIPLPSWWRAVYSLWQMFLNVTWRDGQLLRNAIQRGENQKRTRDGLAACGLFLGDNQRMENWCLVAWNCNRVGGKHQWLVFTSYSIYGLIGISFLFNFSFMSVKRYCFVKYFRTREYDLNINIFYFHNPFCSNKNQCRCWQWDSRHAAENYRWIFGRTPFV